MARLDVELVHRGLATSRTTAQRLIAAGQVRVSGSVVTKPATPVPPEADLDVAEGEEYVSRAAGKLAGALDALAATPLAGPVIAGRRALDAGASTGGFTQVLLQRGASHVVAVDVGTGQLDPRIRSDERVTVLEHTNVRTLDPALVAPPPQVLVADLSFISLRLVLRPLTAAMARTADAIVLIKPQFEVGKERLGAGGVVTRQEDRFDAVTGVLREAHAQGWQTQAVLPSSVPGMHGNHELLAWLRADPVRSAGVREDEAERLAEQAVSGRLAVREGD